jgi:Sulfatase
LSIGGYPKFVQQGFNENFLPLWLQQAGYNTYYTGKLFNAYTVDNYNAPYVAGFNGSDFLLDPYTYSYLNSTYQRNHDPPISYEGRYTADVLEEKAFGFLDEATTAKRPFFLAIAPISPHSNIDPSGTDLTMTNMTAPIPADRHRDLFKGVKVPRTHNFNPDQVCLHHSVRGTESVCLTCNNHSLAASIGSVVCLSRIKAISTTMIIFIGLGFVRCRPLTSLSMASSPGWRRAVIWTILLLFIPQIMDTTSVSIVYNRAKRAGLKKISVSHSSFVDPVFPLAPLRTASPLTLTSFRPSSRLLGSRHGLISMALLSRSGRILTEFVLNMSTWSFGVWGWRRAGMIVLVSLCAVGEGIYCTASAGADYIHFRPR